MNNNVPALWIVIGAMFIVCAAAFLGLRRLIPEKVDLPASVVKEKDIEAPLKA